MECARREERDGEEREGEEEERGEARRDVGRVSRVRSVRVEARLSFRASGEMCVGLEGTGAECQGGQSVGEKAGDSARWTATGASKEKFSNMVRIADALDSCRIGDIFSGCVRLVRGLPVFK